MKKTSLTTFLLIIFALSTAQALTNEPRFIIPLDSRTKTVSWENPLSLMLQTLQPTDSRIHQADQNISLLVWSQLPDQNSQPSEKYNRTAHFGRWINDPTDQSCFNTRQKVLERDSKGQLTTRSNNHCLVSTGHWIDPYTSKAYFNAKEVHVDHVVPLKNAYLAGAWKWTKQLRCLFANYMGNDFHLAAVSSHENMSKSDSGPEGYMPPEQSIQCQYLNNWLSIKAIWGLSLNSAEVHSIAQAIEEYQCDENQFTLDLAFLQSQQKLIASSKEICRAE